MVLEHSTLSLVPSRLNRVYQEFRTEANFGKPVIGIYFHGDTKQRPVSINLVSAPTIDSFLDSIYSVRGAADKVLLLFGVLFFESTGAANSAINSMSTKLKVTSLADKADHYSVVSHVKEVIRLLCPSQLPDWDLRSTEMVTSGFRPSSNNDCIGFIGAIPLLEVIDEGQLCEDFLIVETR